MSDDIFNNIYNKSLDLLSRREHSTKEIKAVSAPPVGFSILVNESNSIPLSINIIFFIFYI